MSLKYLDVIAAVAKALPCDEGAHQHRPRVSREGQSYVLRHWDYTKESEANGNKLYLDAAQRPCTRDLARVYRPGDDHPSVDPRYWRPAWLKRRGT